MFKRFFAIGAAVVCMFTIVSCEALEQLGIGDGDLDIIEDIKEGAEMTFDYLKEEFPAIDELTDLGIVKEEDPLKSMAEYADDKENGFKMTDVDISSLNIDHLTDVQLGLLMQVLAGEMTMGELVVSGEFTLKDFIDIGLFDLMLDYVNKDN